MSPTTALASKRRRSVREGFSGVWSAGLIISDADARLRKPKHPLSSPIRRKNEKEMDVAADKVHGLNMVDD